MTVKYLAGIDEAGRGPIIGPLVIAVAAIDFKKEKELKDLGVKDSKLLTEKQREEILKELLKIVKHELVIIQPQEVDEAVFHEQYNLNWLEADHGANLLNKIDAKLDNNVSRVIIDCPSTNIPAYKNYLKGKVDNQTIELVVEHKADLYHLIVGAASIIAKVTREKELEKLKHKLKVDFGSGYPADPKTQEFLLKNHDNPKYSSIFRKSWAPYRNILDKKKQSKLDSF